MSGGAVGRAGARTPRLHRPIGMAVLLPVVGDTHTPAGCVLFWCPRSAMNAARNRVGGRLGRAGDRGGVRQVCPWWAKAAKSSSVDACPPCLAHTGACLPRLSCPQVYSTIEHAVYNQTHLFYNRHIDQIMLSALYGYCKVGGRYCCRRSCCCCCSCRPRVAHRLVRSISLFALAAAIAVSHAPARPSY